MRNAGRSGRITILSVVACLAMILLGLFGLTGTAHADSRGALPKGIPADVAATIPKGAEVHVSRADMKLDCTHMTAKARSYALAHHYCPTSGESGDVSTKDYVEGDCGASYIYTWDNESGYLGMFFGIESTRGSVVSLVYNVSIANWTDGTSHSVADTVYPFDDDWDRNTEEYTGPGFVTSVFEGDALLWWGGTCYLAFPSDWADVT